MAPPEEGGGAPARNLLRDLAGAALAAALSLAVAAAALHLWSWQPSVPLTYSTDALYYDAVVKGTLDHGWYLENPDLGAPHGLDSHDFPVVSNDSLQLLIVKTMGVVTGRPFLVANAFFLLTFPLNALGAFAALRWRRTPRPLAVLGAAVFGILPLHFMKGVDYLFFVSSYMVPVGCAMVLTVLAGEPLFGRRPDVAGWRGLLGWRTVLIVLLCAAIASASIYYAVFTSLLLATAALARGVLSRSWRAVVEGLGAVGLIGTFVALNQLPTILYRLEHGANPMVAARDPAETEFYGLKLIQLVLPVPGHRIGAFADLTDRYRATSKVLGEPSTSIGLVATVGLAWLVVAALLAILGPDRRLRATAGERHAAFLVVVAFLWANAGGISTILSYTLTAQLRAWSRMSVYLGFLGVLGALALLDRLRRWLAPRAGLPVLGAVLAALFVLAALDHTSGRLAPDDAIEREYHSDADFVRRIENLLPSGTAVLQLPYVAYPEVPPTNRLGAYDQLRPYLHSSRLRWSFGAMKGRPEDWHAHLAAAPLPSLLAGAVAAGFGGVVVDRFGYVDAGAALERELESIAGPPAVVSATDRLAFWDLRPLGERLRAAGQPMEVLAEATLRPLRLDFDDGFYTEEAQPGSRWRWARERAAITIENPRDEPVRALVGATVEVPDGVATVRLPGGATETFLSSAGERGRLAGEVLLPPGRSTLQVESDADPVPATVGDKRRLVVRLVDLVVLPASLCTAGLVLAPEPGGDCLAGSRAHVP